MRAVTSASNLFRRFLCPGSAHAEEGILDRETEWSAEGTMLHKLILSRISKAATTDDRPLTPDQVESLDEAERLFRHLLAEVYVEFGITEDEPFEDRCEQELIVTSPDMTPLFPGHSDLIRIWGDYLGTSFSLIVDFKFGFADIEEAPSNLQLASYALAHWQKQGSERTIVAIIQPRNFGPRVTRAIYEAESIGAAYVELERIVLASCEPDAPRIAGEKQCQNCKAKVACPEFNGPLRQLVAREQFAVQTLTNADLEFLHEVGRRWNKIKDEVSDELRERIRLGGMPGWTLKNNGSTKNITDLLALYNRFTEEFPGEDLATRFMACVSPKWEPLTALVMELANLPKQKARERLEEIAAGLIAEEPKEKSPRKL